MSERTTITRRSRVVMIHLKATLSILISFLFCSNDTSGPFVPEPIVGSPPVL